MSNTNFNLESNSEVTPVIRFRNCLDLFPQSCPAVPPRVAKSPSECLYIPDQVRNVLILNTWTGPTPTVPTARLEDVPVDLIKLKTYLDQKNPHVNDARIAYVDSTHMYYIDGSCQWVISGTSVLKAFFSEFDPKKQSESTFASNTFSKKKGSRSYKYYGCESPQDIRACYVKARDLGTALHENIEHYFNNGEREELLTIHEENRSAFQQFLSFRHNSIFWKDLRPYRTEMQIFDPNLRICGQIDLLCQDLSACNTYVIMDWKRTSSISHRSFERFKTYRKRNSDERLSPESYQKLIAACKGTGCCSDLEDCNFIKYSLQLNLYKYILETYYGMKICMMLLVQLHPDQKTPIIHKCEDLDRVVADIIETRRQVLEGLVMEQAAE